MTPGGALAQGYVVADRFQLTRLLGRGGMGSVWMARHLSLNIDVAVKFIDGALGGRDDLRSRFAQEARTAARIQSPHVVNILDYGFDGARPFIAMELLQGEPLGVRLERERRIPTGQMATILTQAAKGLTRAHSLGIVHRDLKPDNLFLARDEEGEVHVKILDFGIARDDTPLGGGASHRTGTGQLLGTPAYMSPEQALGKSQIDFRSDLYSLAVVVYHCIAGRLPFDTDALGELIVSISTMDPPLPSTIAPGLGPGIDSWFRTAFQKDPAGRFASAKEMADTFALACRASSPAFDRTVLAQETAGATARDLPRFSAPGPSTPGLATGAPAVYGSGTPAPTANWSMAGTSAPRDRMSAPNSYPGTPAPAVQAGAGRTAPMPVVRVPDTFNGQSNTQDGPMPVLPTRGPPPLLVGLIGLIVVVGLGGAALIMKARGHEPSAAGGLAGSAEVVPLPSASIAASASPAAPAPPSAPSAAPSASASVHPPASPPALHPAPTRQPSPPSAAKSPPAAAPAPAPKPAPKPAPTNDYGL